MGRPSEPLIDPDAAVAAALRIIDRDGLDALSIRSLGAEVGAHGSSLYHHFRNKQEILDRVSEVIVADIDVDDQTTNFSDWIVGLSVSYRRALLAHPNAMVLIIDRLPGSQKAQIQKRAFAHFESVGIDEVFWIPIIEQIQAFNAGSAFFLRERATRPPARRRKPGAPQRTHLLSDDAQFEVAFRALFAGLVTYYRKASDPARR
jgi:TetR/AcrR family transcriptional regulator, tetracycline repressor protein